MPFAFGLGKTVGKSHASQNVRELPERYTQLALGRIIYKSVTIQHPKKGQTNPLTCLPQPKITKLWRLIWDY